MRNGLEHAAAVLAVTPPVAAGSAAPPLKGRGQVKPGQIKLHPTIRKCDESSANTESKDGKKREGWPCFRNIRYVYAIGIDDYTTVT